MAFSTFDRTPIVCIWVLGRVWYKRWCGYIYLNYFCVRNYLTCCILKHVSFLLLKLNILLIFWTTCMSSTGFLFWGYWHRKLQCVAEAALSLFSLSQFQTFQSEVMCSSQEGRSKGIICSLGGLQSVWKSGNLRQHWDGWQVHCSQTIFENMVAQTFPSLIQDVHTSPCPYLNLFLHSYPYLQY